MATPKEEAAIVYYKARLQGDHTVMSREQLVITNMRLTEATFNLIEDRDMRHHDGK